MPRTILPYDPTVEDLAEHFLQDEHRSDDHVGYRARVIALSITIQRAVEDWFNDNPVEDVA